MVSTQLQSLSYSSGPPRSVPSHTHAHLFIVQVVMEVALYLHTGVGVGIESVPSTEVWVVA